MRGGLKRVSVIHRTDRTHSTVLGCKNGFEQQQQEQHVNHRQTVAEISKRLPRLKRRDVAEVLEVMAELWLEALSEPGQTVTVADLGKLVVEVQTFQSGGVVGKRPLRRLYVRFRPTGKFRQAILKDALYKEGTLK
jgi:hypothetical protein